MSPDGKVRLLVNSRNVPARTIVLSRPIVSLSGLTIGTEIRTGVVYDTSFDERNRTAIREAKKLSCNLNLSLEIIDRSKLSPLRRIITALAGPESRSPSLVVSS